MESDDAFFLGGKTAVDNRRLGPIARQMAMDGEDPLETSDE
jgi:hypothetical protein